MMFVSTKSATVAYDGISCKQMFQPSFLILIMAIVNIIGFNSKNSNHDRYLLLSMINILSSGSCETWLWESCDFHWMNIFPLYITDVQWEQQRLHIPTNDCIFHIDRIHRQRLQPLALAHIPAAHRFLLQWRLLGNWSSTSLLLLLGMLSFCEN